jgi:molybdopterin molybdotransferase
MLSVEEARERILAHFQRLPAEDAPLPEALGRILAGAVVAPDDLPPFANSAMDGYAIQAADSVGASQVAPVALRLVGAVPAGRVYEGVVGSGEAVRILTGAPLPAGADAVLQQELTEVDGEVVKLLAEAPRGLSVRPAGDDARAGQRVMEAGGEIGPAEIALLAAVGAHPVRVTRRPRVAIISTGDELAALGEQLRPGQIRESNSAYLAAAVTRAGGEPLPLGIARDNTDQIRERLQQARGADLVLTSGGVSVGDFDLVKQVLSEDGDIDFWRVRMRPGKPLAFGLLGATPLLGLPGNPVSAAVTFELFGRPVIRLMLGARTIERPTVAVVYEGEDLARSDRRHFVRARLDSRGGSLVALPTGDQGSHRLSSLGGATALLVIMEGEGVVRSGSIVGALLLNDALPWGAA